MTDKHQNTEPLLSKQTLLPASLTKLAKKVISQNRAIGNKIAIAESCTGGLVAASLTEIPGSSEVLDRAFITYSNEAKIECLKVDQKIIDPILNDSSWEPILSKSKIHIEPLHSIFIKFRGCNIHP